MVSLVDDDDEEVSVNYDDDDDFQAGKVFSEQIKAALLCFRYSLFCINMEQSLSQGPKFSSSRDARTKARSDGTIP